MTEGMVSVIMGAYNCANTLPEAIDSILGQTYENLQLIICNDCSTDETDAVLQAYAAKDARIVLLQNDANSGLAASLNHCLRYVQGQYVARMDGDDVSVRDRFEKQVRFLQEHPQFDLVGCTMRRFNDAGTADVVSKPESVSANSMRRIIPFNHATIMTYPRVYEALNGYTVAKHTLRAEDYELWFRFFHAGFSGYNMQEALYLVREDMNAIRRRTFRSRRRAFQVTRFGFRLLGFPRHWLIPKLLRFLAKSMVPYRCIGWYRSWQKKHRK